jgi:glycine/D-amino acid oxidase-like deaminating enzyme
VIERCLWTEDAPPTDRAPTPLPDRCDVAVVGGGYTGLAAARALARHGASVVVLERHTVGWGASGRNGGFVLPGYKPDVAALARKLGLDEARRLFGLSLEAVDSLERLIRDEQIACDYARCGWITLAARPRHLRGLAKDAKFLRDKVHYETTVLGKRDLEAEIGSDRYHGGLLDPGAGSLHPGRYVRGLALAAERAGALIAESSAVQSIRQHGKSAILHTDWGPVRARDVLVATNAYTGPAFADLQRRVVPVGSYIVASSQVDPGFCGRLMPQRRVFTDTRDLLHYFRLTRDGRVLFGGRAAFTPLPVAEAARLLGKAMVETFPDLRLVDVEYAWEGKVAFALDQMPHAGRLGQLHYSLAYAGHGVAMSTWLGTRMGDALAGTGPLPSLCRRFPPIPFYHGRPWFLPLVGAYYRLKDRLV